jgi:hypothetical protein
MEAPVDFRCWNLGRERPVAITWSPRARMLCTNCSPKPEEHPVMGQVSWGI